jgi:hypothetical protein
VSKLLHGIVNQPRIAIAVYIYRVHEHDMILVATRVVFPGVGRPFEKASLLV